MNFGLDLQGKLSLFRGYSKRPADIFISNNCCGKNLFVDVVVTCPVKHKYAVAAVQTLGFSCNDCAEVVKTKTLEARVYEEDALYLPVFEPFAGFSRGLPIFIFRINKKCEFKI